MDLERLGPRNPRLRQELALRIPMLLKAMAHIEEASRQQGVDENTSRNVARLGFKSLGFKTKKEAQNPKLLNPTGFRLKGQEGGGPR